MADTERQAITLRDLGIMRSADRQMPRGTVPSLDTITSESDFIVREHIFEYAYSHYRYRPDPPKVALAFNYFIDPRPTSERFVHVPADNAHGREYALNGAPQGLGPVEVRKRTDVGYQPFFDEGLDTQRLLLGQFAAQVGGVIECAEQIKEQVLYIPTSRRAFIPLGLAFASHLQDRVKADSLPKLF